MAFDPISQYKCEHCGHPFSYGRSDRRFCNDTCRNSFNRKKRAEERIELHERAPEIFKIIKKNYEILKAITKGDSLEWKQSTYVTTEEMEQKGFDPQFCTSIKVDGINIWKFCFERGWRLTSNEKHYEIIDNQGQV